MSLAADFARDLGRRDERLGVLLMLAGLALFSIANAAIKVLAETFPISQIVVFRNVFALVPLLLVARSLGGLGLLWSRDRKGQLVQAVLFCGSVYGFFAAMKLMPITDATAISFAQPLIVVALAAPLLDERVRPVDWIAVAAGLAGVSIMVRPTGAGLDWGAAAAIGATVASAFGMLQLRSLSRRDHSIAITVWTMAISAALSLPLLAVQWVTPTPAQFLALAGMGIGCGALQYLTTRALHHASPAALAPATYTKIVWAAAIDVVWFAAVPTPQVLIGSAIVIVAATIVVRRGNRTL